MKVTLTKEQYTKIMKEYQKRYNATNKVKIFSYYLGSVFKEDNNCEVKFIRDFEDRGGLKERYELTFDREEDYTWFRLKWM